MGVKKMNNYELIFRRYGGVTTVVLVIVSVISIAIVINKTRLLYKNESIYKIQDRSFNNLEILLKMKEIE